jgi:hypothetical protein
MITVVDIIVYLIRDLEEASSSFWLPFKNLLKFEVEPASFTSLFHPTTPTQSARVFALVGERADSPFWIWPRSKHDLAFGDIFTCIPTKSMCL